MTKPPAAQDDPRSVDELIAAALTATDEQVTWDAVRALHWRGSREVLLRAQSLCGSPCSRERVLGADILGQLGVPDRAFPSECGQRLRDMLGTEQDAGVLRSVLVALSHQQDAASVPEVANFVKHPDPEVRHAAVLALTGHDMPLAIESLILLTTDPDPRVRDWSTFALGTQLDLDTPAIRDALANRLDDPDSDARGEALVGLARRRDERVIPALRRELSSDCVGTLAIEASELIASPQLLPELLALRPWWDVDAALLEQAITASQTAASQTIASQT